jgi:feruloyl-CoA synthase
MHGEMSELFAAPSVVRQDRADGSVLLTSPEPLAPYPATAAEWLRSWAAAEAPYPCVAQRTAGGSWEVLSYGEVLAAANSVSQALLDRGLSAERPLMILSGNSIGHFLVTMGAYLAGVPVVPVSVAYSLQSKDHERLRVIGGLVQPGAVYVETVVPFAAAIGALAGDPLVIAGEGGPKEHSLPTLLATAAAVVEEEEEEETSASVTGASVAKILFTSGSTGIPKGVLTTHEMLCANQEMMRQAWPFLAEERPVLVDWLPWSHTFGGSHNMNMVLANGGTLYIDEGRPAPSLIAATLANYRDVSPTMAFNVPAGYAQLVPALEADHELARQFFARIRLVFNAAAALPSALRGRLETLAREVTGRDVPVTGSWGTTETAPAATTAHFGYADGRCIGNPLPGVTLKLVPDDADVYEIRVRGVAVTPGYLSRPDLATAAFDDEGFYCPGDAVSFADPADPARGLLFRGRLAEDFKLSTGTFVRVGALRTALLSAAPVIGDAVITGQDRDTVGALTWLNPAELPEDLAGTWLNDGPVLYSPQLAEHLGALLATLNCGQGSAGRIERLIVLAQPASLDDGEITDKGYVNQRRVLANRAELVELLYADQVPEKVITPARKRSHAV